MKVRKVRGGREGFLDLGFHYSWLPVSENTVHRNNQICEIGVIGG